MSSCVTCKQVVGRRSPGICCSTCLSSFHGKCVGLDAAAITALSRDGTSWNCQTCRVRSTGRRSLFDVTPGAPADSPPRPVGGVTLDSLYGMLLDIRADVRAVKQNYDDLQASVNFCSQKITDFEGTIKVLNEKCKTIDKVAAEGVSLRREYEHLKTRVEELEQYSRRSNLEIQGVPETSGENVSSLLNGVARFLNVEMAASDIDAVHRVPHFSGITTPKSIVVKFTRRAKRDEFLAAAVLKRKSLPAGSPPGFNIDGVSDRCFINEHLTSANKALFAKTRLKARASGYLYVWTRDCKIFVRKNNTSQAIRILSEGSLNSL